MYGAAGGGDVGGASAEGYGGWDLGMAAREREMCEGGDVKEEISRGRCRNDRLFT